MNSKVDSYLGGGGKGYVANEVLFDSDLSDK